MMARSLSRRAAADDIASKPVFDDPTDPPTSSKKLAYAVWFLAIQILEVVVIRKQTAVFDNTTAIWSTFALHSQVFHILAYIAVDLITLKNLNALRSSWGVSRPRHLQGRRILLVSEENSVLLRHALKLVIRVPFVSSTLLGARPGFFAVYCLKQVLLMVGSPTFFGVYFAVESREGLLKMALVNAAFCGVVARSFTFAFAGEPALLGKLCADCGCSATPATDIATIGVLILAAAPYVCAAILRFPRLPSRARGGARAGPRPERVVGLADDGSSVLESCAISLSAGSDERRVIVVQELLEGTTIRVMFDGGRLPCATEKFRGGEHTLLTIYAPPRDREGAELSAGLSSGVDVEPEPLVGLAWVVTVRPVEPTSRGGGRSRRRQTIARGGSTVAHEVDDAGEFADDDVENFTRVGAGVPLLFVPSPEVAEEINSGAATIRRNLDANKANKFITRVGNCITPSTTNREDLSAVLEVTSALDMRLTEKMLMQMHFTNRPTGSEVSGTSARRGVQPDGDARSDDEREDAVEGPLRDATDATDAADGRAPSTSTGLESQLESQSWWLSLFIAAQIAYIVLMMCDVASDVALAFACANFGALGIIAMRSNAGKPPTIEPRSAAPEDAPRLRSRRRF
jgi:hypothetical protein